MSEYISQLNDLNAENESQEAKYAVDRQRAEQRKRIGLSEPPAFPHRRR